MNFDETMIVPPTDMHIGQHRRATVPFRSHQEYPKRETEPLTDDCTQGHGFDPGDLDTVEVHKNGAQEFDWKVVSRNGVLHTIHPLNQLNLDLKVRLEVDVSLSLYP